MSITRGHWSEDEKKAVLDCYNAATDADGFFVLLKGMLGAAFARRSAKAYLTYLNEVLLPKTDPRRPVYQSLCDLNQKEIAARKAAEEAAKLAASASLVVPVVVTPAVAAPVLAADGQGEAPVVSDTYNWVEAEVDVVPRVPPGRVAPPSLFRDPALPTLKEAMASQAAERAAELAVQGQAKFDSAQAELEAIAARVPEFATAPSRTACVLLHTELTDNLAAILRGILDIPATHRATLGQRINDVKACITAAYTVACMPFYTAPVDVKRSAVRELLATDEGRKTLAASMTQPIRGTARAVSAEPVSKPAVTPDPTALVPRHYPALPPKAKLTADEVAQVFGLHRTKVVDAFAYGFVQTLDGTHISHRTAQRIHDAMSEGHSFSEACRQVNPNATGLLPMEALIEKVDEFTEDDQSAVVLPDTEAGEVTLKVHEWKVMGRPLNPKSVAAMAEDLNTRGPLFVGPVEVLSGPKSLFQGGEVFPFANPVETPNPVSEPPLEDPSRMSLVEFTPELASEVAPGASERYTLEAVRDGVITVAQAADILAPTDTRKAVWALGLLASGHITVVQCDRLIFAKTVPFPGSL